MQALRRALAWVGLIEGDTPPPTEKRLAENFRAFFEQQYGGRSIEPCMNQDGEGENGGACGPGRNCPDFQALSYLSALEKAKAQMRCLFVYIHGPHHFNTPVFCRQLCASTSTLKFLSDSFLCWGASAGERDGYNAAIEFNATDFPFIAVVCPGVPAAQVLFRAAGEQAMVAPDELVTRISRAVAANEEIVNRAREQQRKRDHDRMLTTQQDLDYQAAMQQDSERKARERAARLAERVEREAAEEKIRAARELEAQAQASRESKLEEARRLVAEELAPEPNSKPYAVLRFQLPDGGRFGRKFEPCTTLKQLRAFVTVELANREVPIERFNLFLNSKRRVFTADGEHCDATLQDVGISADVLLVQDLDA